MRELRGKVAVVTGAASGIGRALAICLAERGCALAVVDVQKEALADTAARISAHGRVPSVHEVDVSDREAMRALPDAVLAAHGNVDILVNNAAITAGYHFEDHPLDHFERVLDVNLLGVVYGCKFFLPHLRQRPEAHIVNLSSMFGLIGYPGQSAYCASKFAVRGLSEVLWTELAASPVRVTCVMPGGVRTNLLSRAPGWPEGVEAVTRQFEQAVRRTPEQAALRIVRAIEREEARVRLGFESLIVDWLKRLLPVAPQRWLTGTAAQQAQAKQSGASGTTSGAAS